MGSKTKEQRLTSEELSIFKMDNKSNLIDQKSKTQLCRIFWTLKSWKTRRRKLRKSSSARLVLIQFLMLKPKISLARPIAQFAWVNLQKMNN